MSTHIRVTIVKFSPTSKTVNIFQYRTDRGTQYCCDDYVSLLRDSNIQISMTQSGSPYDNAIAERVNGILKMEFDMEKTFKNVAQAKNCVEIGIHKYNNLRLHASCQFQTPQNTHLLENVVQKPKKVQVY